MSSRKSKNYDDDHSTLLNTKDMSGNTTLDEDSPLNTSFDSVINAVSEMVEITSKKLSGEKCSTSQEVGDNPPESINKEDLPVRRSSRIQRLAVKKVEEKKKSPLKPKNPKSSNNFETNSSSKVVPESEETLLNKSSSSQANSKIQSISTPPDVSKSDKAKTSKVVKKSDKKVSQKIEKEDTKTEKGKSEKKKTINKKKKQNSDNSENIQNQPPSETKCSSNTSSDSSVNHSDENKSVLINVEILDNSTFGENKSPEILSSSIKPSDNQIPDIKEKSENNSAKPVKVKSRWWRSSELEGVLNTNNEPNSAPTENINSPKLLTKDELLAITTNIELNVLKVKDESNILLPNDEIPSKDMNSEPSLLAQPVYEHIEENIYKFTRKKSKNKKQNRRMVCDCTLTKEEIEYGVLGCKEECLNRLLMIECGSRCPIGEACSNKKFQKKQYIDAEIFKTEKKGWGLRALTDISRGEFLMEFVGEVLNHKEYRQRVKLYAKEKNVHCYFMALKTDEILDATYKGNLTRFINHSCDPNCETQKWTVNGELRVGVFSKRTIKVGEEFTLDYKFQRYGREAQKCFCKAENCSGYIGGAKQISVDAYSTSKSVPTKKKKGSDDKKRDWEDMILEEEIEKLNTSKGLRNREETLKLARLMVRADDSVTRHQILDIIIKTEEQACLRLFLDYHGLPLMWSWMTDIVDLDLKAKILQVLSLLPISNKTMLIDSKVMNVVEKWVQECDGSKKDISTENKSSTSDNASSENSQPPAKKLKNVDFSDNETDSTDSHNAVDNSSENSVSLSENSAKVEIFPSETMQNETPSEEKSSLSIQGTDTVPKDDLSIKMKTNISNIGVELLTGWKNLKEVFRIPRLEQQKRKEDELEDDHKIPKCTKVEEEKPKPEVTGDHIQVLISAKTPSFSDNIRTFESDNQDVSYKMDDRPRKNLLPVSQNVHIHRHKRTPSFSKPIIEEAAQRHIKDESDSSLDSASPLLSSVVASPVIQPSNRPALLPTPTFINQAPVNFPPPINTTIPPHPQLDQPPQPVYPPHLIYPPSQAPFMTAGPPPVLPHTATSMPPPSSVLPQAAPILTQPPPSTNIPTCPPVNPGLLPNPTNFHLPPNMPPSTSIPVSSQFIPNQTTSVSSYPPGPNPFGNQNQPFYFVQPPTVPISSSQTTFTENVCAQSTTVLPMPSPNHLSLPSAFPLHTSSLPNQASTTLPMQTVNPLPMSTTSSVPVQPTTFVPIDPIVESDSPVIKEEPKPIKLPKNWRSATDSEGNVYYYHSITRQTQWDPPSADQVDDDSDDEEEDSDSDESESSDTPTYDEPKISTKHTKRKLKKRKTTNSAADTTCNFPVVRPETAKKIKELFRTKMSSYIVHCLNSYRKPDCKVGRITSNEDFKYLARKLTHYTMTKELKQCKNVEDLDCNDCVMGKAKDFIKKYMSKYGSKYVRKEKFSPDT